MSLPTQQETPETIAAFCHEVSRFCEKHSTILAREAGTKRKLDKEALNHTSTLRSTDAKVEQEALEDYNLLTHRNTLLTKTQRMIRSIRAGVKLRLKDNPEGERILKSFTTVAPSGLRTEKLALVGLSEMRRALQTHKSKLTGTVDRTSDWLAQVEQLLTGFEHIANERSKEDAETSEARQQRDKTKEAAIRFLQEVELLVMALEWEHPELLEDWETLLSRIS
jgi:hypothetical protein